MNILLVNQNWLAEELKQLGQKPFSVGPYPGKFDLTIREPILELKELLKRIPPESFPDRIVYYDNSALPWITGFAQSEIPSLYYSVDTHQHPRWHPPYSAVFDLCFVAQKDYIDSFSPFQSSVVWFPPWAPRTSLQAIKTRSVVFRGTLSPQLNPQRIEFLTRVSELVPVDFSTGEFEFAYADSKIVLNHCVKDDLNFRVFEAMACGALLITPRIGNGLEELFQDGKDIITYHSHDPVDAAEKIKYFLENDSERKRIAYSGFRKVAERHVAAQRAQTLLEYLQPLQRNTHRKKYIGAAYACLTGASVWADKGQSQYLLLKNAADALVASLKTSEWDFVETVACIVLCGDFLQRSGYSQEEKVFLGRLAESGNGGTAPRVLLIDSLLKMGDFEAARVLAGQITDDVEGLLRDLPSIVENLRQEANFWFYGN